MTNTMTNTPLLFQEIFAAFTSSFVTPSNEFSLQAVNTSNPFVTVRNTALIDYDSGRIRYDLQVSVWHLNVCLFLFFMI